MIGGIIGLEIGASDFIIQPLPIRELITHINCGFSANPIPQLVLGSGGQNPTTTIARSAFNDGLNNPRPSNLCLLKLSQGLKASSQKHVPESLTEISDWS